VKVICLTQGAFRIADSQIDKISFLDQSVDLFGVAREGLLKKTEQVIQRGSFVVVPELDVISLMRSTILNDQADISIIGPVFIDYPALHIFLPQQIQQRHCFTFPR
jgi:hypothetical protein